MRTILFFASSYAVFAAAVLTLHLVSILWVIFGGLVTGHRPFLSGLHAISLVYGIVIEVAPWPCPLTLVEQWLQGKAGLTPYTESFLVHYLDELIYPDVSQDLLVWCAVGVVLFNFCVYGRRLSRSYRASHL